MALLSPSPPSPLPPTPHLFALLESNPYGLHALVVGDGSCQGESLVGVLHPGQVGAFLGVLAPPLREELSVPGLLREMGRSLSTCVPRWAYLSLVPGLGLREVLEAAEPVVGPAVGAVVYVPAICLGGAGMRDSQRRSLQRSVAPSWPRYRSSCPPSRGTHRLRAGAPRSPAAGGRVWPLPPSSLLPVKARESHTRSFEDRGCHLCPESAHLPPCGLSLAPLSCLQEITGCASLSAPRHRSLPHACTPRPRHGLESPAPTGSRLSWLHQSQTRQEAPGRAKLLCGDKRRVL